MSLNTNAFVIVDDAGCFNSLSCSSSDCDHCNTVNKCGSDDQSALPDLCHWSVWSSWTACAEPCSGGVRQRYRHPLASSREPRCRSHQTQSQSCNTGLCPGTITLTWVRFKITWTEKSAFQHNKSGRWNPTHSYNGIWQHDEKFCSSDASNQTTISRVELVFHYLATVLLLLLWGTVQVRFRWSCQTVDFQRIILFFDSSLIRQGKGQGLIEAFGFGNCCSEPAAGGQKCSKCR